MDWVRQVNTGLAIATLVLGLVSVIVIPLLIWAVRNAVQSARVNDRLVGLAEDIRDVVNDIKDYKRITDRRLTWLEQNLWKKDR